METLAMTDTPEKLLDDMAEALKNLIEASGHMSPFGSEASVKNVRLAGKYMQRLDIARAILAKYDAYVESRETGG